MLFLGHDSDFGLSKGKFQGKMLVVLHFEQILVVSLRKH